MASSNTRDVPDTHPQDPRSQTVNLARIRNLVNDLEQEVTKTPDNAPNLLALRKEIATLKNILQSSSQNREWVDERLHTIRNTLQTAAQTVEGEFLRDTPYIAEIGRILGL
ncbi:MAG TPA: hypothetical protein VHK70_08725 [Burkholderiaceae bacterium]|jgi:predicted  nucleic acid-binding Zn-ribbon protein|nr:hypothetical protein [Burkholderiaceae bacterium]